MSQLVDPVLTVYGAGESEVTVMFCAGGEASPAFEENASCAGTAFNADVPVPDMVRLTGITCGLLVMPGPEIVSELL